MTNPGFVASGNFQDKIIPFEIILVKKFLRNSFYVFHHTSQLSWNPSGTRVVYYVSRRVTKCIMAVPTAFSDLLVSYTRPHHFISQKRKMHVNAFKCVQAKFCCLVFSFFSFIICNFGCHIYSIIYIILIIILLSIISTNVPTDCNILSNYKQTLSNSKRMIACCHFNSFLSRAPLNICERFLPCEMRCNRILQM